MNPFEKDWTKEEVKEAVIAPAIAETPKPCSLQSGMVAIGEPYSYLGGGMLASGSISVFHLQPSRIRTDSVVSGDRMGPREMDFNYHYDNNSRSRIKADERLLLFAIDMMASTRERGIIKRLVEQPESKDCRQEYVNFLQSQGRYTSAQLVEGGWTPGEV